MKRTRQEQEKDMRSALEMLERVQTGGATTAAGDGPVDPNFAVGWARASLRRALGLSGQLTEGES